MSTSDRNFVRVGPRASSGLGNLRVISFNTWLIIINVAVFVVAYFMSASPAFKVHTAMGHKWEPGTTSEQVERAVLVDQVGPDPENPGWLFKPIVDPVTGRMIGRDRFVYMNVLESFGHFSTAKAFVPGFEVWRFVTFQFLHYNWIHLLFNMLGLWLVGGLVEQHLGSKRYAAFYLTCGIFGALLYLLLNFIGYVVGSMFGQVRIPGLLFNDVYTPLIGASAGVFGVLIGAARLEPMATIWVYFVIPLRLRTVVTIFVLITLFNLFTGSHNAGGEAAHVGGIIAGFYFIRRIYLLRDFFDVFGNSRLPPKNAPPDPAIAREQEIDRILHKTKTEGAFSLTPQERETLQEFNELQQQT